MLRTFSAAWLCLTLLCLSSEVRANDAEKTKVYGTGFVVGDGTTILTAFHVIRDKRQILIGSGQPIKWEVAQLVATDSNDDLALLRIDQPRSALSLALWSSVPIGIESIVVGYPLPSILGFSLKLTEGVVNGERNSNGVANLFQTSAPIHSGNSGGPIFAPDGSVIGMALATMQLARAQKVTGERLQLVNFAVKSSALRAFLGRAGIDPLVRPVDLSNYLRPYQIYRMSEPSIVIVLGSGS